MERVVLHLADLLNSWDTMGQMLVARYRNLAAFGYAV